MQGRSALNIVKKYHPNVTRLVDAKRSIKITVTADDCKNAEKGAPSKCAMARAFCKEFDGAVISKSVSYLVKGDRAIRYRTPESVVREIVSFDRNQNFAPGDYGLRAPTVSSSIGKTYRASAPGKSHRIGGHQGGKTAAKKTAAKKPKRHIHKTAGVRSL